MRPGGALCTGGGEASSGGAKRAARAADRAPPAFRRILALSACVRGEETRIQAARCV